MVDRIRCCRPGGMSRYGIGTEMNYTIDTDTTLGRRIPLIAVAHAMALRDAMAGGTPFHKPMYDGKITGYINGLSNEVYAGRLKLCGSPLPGDPGVTTLRLLNKWGKERGDHFTIAPSPNVMNGGKLYPVIPVPLASTEVAFLRNAEVEWRKHYGQTNSSKDPHAVALGRKGGRKGGLKAAANMTPEERKARGRKAINARWKKATAPPADSAAPSSSESADPPA